MLLGEEPTRPTRVVAGVRLASELMRRGEKPDDVKAKLVSRYKYSAEEADQIMAAAMPLAKQTAAKAERTISPLMRKAAAASGIKQVAALPACSIWQRIHRFFGGKPRCA